jgi:hypothetical protein
MKKHYQFERGLGKNDIGIARARCEDCRKAGVTLHKEARDGKKIYLCKSCDEAFHLKKSREILNGR